MMAKQQMQNNKIVCAQEAEFLCELKIFELIQNERGIHYG